MQCGAAAAHACEGRATRSARRMRDRLVLVEMRTISGSRPGSPNHLSIGFAPTDTGRLRHRSGLLSPRQGFHPRAGLY